MKRITKLSTLVTIGILATLLIALPAQPAKAQFVLAWDYDSESGNGFDYDEYGHGFYMYHLVTNYTYPDWNLHPDYIASYYFNTSSHLFTWDVGYTMGLRIWAWMNSTLTGASDLDDGLTFMRVNATLTNSFGVEVDSQDNLTSFYETTYFDAEMWLYGYEAFFDVYAEAGVTYTATLTYEVYW